MYICLCHGVTDHQIRECVEQGACSIQQLREQLGVGASCGRCVFYAEEVLHETLSAIEAGLRSAA